MPKIDYLPSGAMSVRVQSPTGKRRRATARTIEGIYAKLEEIGTVRVREAWDSYIETLRGQWQTIVKGYARNHLKTLLDCRPDSLTPARLAGWYRVLREKVGPKTADNVYQSFAACCKLAGWGEPLPWGRWRPPRVPKEEKREAARNLEELTALLRAARDKDTRARKRGQLGDWTARIGISALCGLRQSELAALAWDDWDEERSILHVRRALKVKGDGRRPPDPPKGHKVRSARLHPNAQGLLVEQRVRLQEWGCYDPKGPVFPAPDGKFRRTPGQTIDQEAFRGIVRAADLPNPEKWTPHSARHTFATLETLGAWMQTGDVRAAMARTGHSRVETLLGYLHRAGRGLEPVFMPAFPMPVAALDILPPSPDHLTPDSKRLTLKAGSGNEAETKSNDGQKEGRTK